MLFILYFDFFNHNDPTALRIVKKSAEGGHRGAEYVLAVVSIFEGDISMREGLMYIANMKKNMPVIVRRCRHHLRCILN